MGMGINQPSITANSEHLSSNYASELPRNTMQSLLKGYFNTVKETVCGIFSAFLKACTNIGTKIFGKKHETHTKKSEPGIHITNPEIANKLLLSLKYFHEAKQMREEKKPLEKKLPEEIDAKEMEAEKLWQESHEVDLAPVKYLYPAGQGAHGSADYVISGKAGPIIIKKTSLEKTSENTGRPFKQELDVLKNLNHPNIIKAVSTSLEKDAFFMEAGGASLEILIEKIKNPAPIDISNIIKQIFKCVSYLHKKGVAHHDLQMSNILIHPDERVKIIDFGEFKYFSDDNNENKKLINRDIEMAGWILQNLMQEIIKKQKVSEHVCADENKYPDFVDLRNKLITDNHKPISIESALEHPFFQKTVQSTEDNVEGE